MLRERIASSTELPYFWETEERESKKILEKRMVKRENRALNQVLINWKETTASYATWEDYAMIA